MTREQKLLAALDRLEPRLRREVERALAKLRRRLSIEKLLEVLESGDTWPIAAIAGAQARDLEKAVELISQAFNAGRASAAQTVTFSANFQLTNPFAVTMAQRSAAKFVTGVSRETRKAIRTVITHAFTEGIAPRQAARLIRPVIGLTARQAQAVVNRRADLLKSGATESVAQAKVQKYADRLLKQRAEMIARTEIIKASTDGQLSLWAEAKALGLIPQTAEATWITTPDDRLCPVCEAMDGETVLVGQMFETELGAVPGPPAHPNCRCAIALDAKSIGVRRVAA